MHVVAFVAGLCLFILAFPLLILTERAAVASFAEHSAGLGQVVEVKVGNAGAGAGAARTGGGWAGKLIHLTTKTFGAPMPAVKDLDLGIAVDGCLALSRRVEMLQWVETNTAGMRAGTAAATATAVANAVAADAAAADAAAASAAAAAVDAGYSYALTWASEPRPSQSFHDRSYVNPPFRIQPDVSFTPPFGVALVVGVDTFQLSAEDARAFLRGRERYDVTDDMLRLGGVVGDGNNILGGAGTGAGTGAGRSGNRKALRLQDFKLHDGVLYTGAWVGNGAKEVGNLRVSYSVTLADQGLSIIAGVDDAGTLVPFALPNGKKIFMVVPGTHSATAMVRRAEFENGLRMSSYRVACFLLFFGGLMLGLPQLASATRGAAGGTLVAHLADQERVCFVSGVTAAVLMSVIVGLMWVGTSFAVGGPLLMFAPVALLASRSFLQAKDSSVAYSRVATEVDQEVDFGLPENDENTEA